MITSIFFNKYKGEVLFSIYIFSIVITAFTAYFVNKLFFKGEDVPLVMELPRYRIPTLRNILIYMWNKGSHFIEKAGTIIFAASIVVWFLSYFPSNGQIETSFAAYLGKLIEPILKPLGFNWQIATSLLFGASAKEVIVSSLSMLYGFAENDLSTAKLLISQSMSGVSAYAFLIFVLLYFPCFATLSSIKSETGSWKWVFFSVIYSFIVAYIFSYLIVLIGNIIF